MIDDEIELPEIKTRFTVNMKFVQGWRVPPPDASLLGIDDTAMGRKLSDTEEPYATLMHLEQRQAAEIQRRGWSPCQMTAEQWDALQKWSEKVID